MEFPVPVFVCDVGGTNVRIGVVDTHGGEVRQIFNEAVANHSSLLATIKLAEQRARVRARSLIVCAAGPVEAVSVALTNADWVIDGSTLAQSLGLEQGLLLNDFEAQAISLPHLHPSDTLEIVSGGFSPHQPQLALGPGTGLGAAALLRAGTAWLPVTTEAGHMGLGPDSRAEEKIWGHLERVDGRITAEAILSGPGLRRLYNAVRASRGEAAIMVADAQIPAAAEMGEDAARETIELFWRIAARFSGDLALAYLARGGVTLTGGVLPHLVPWLDRAEFRRVFCDKAPMAALVGKIPVRLVTASNVVLGGMAALASNPATYAIDFGNRAWVR